MTSRCRGWFVVLLLFLLVACGSSSGTRPSVTQPAGPQSGAATASHGFESLTHRCDEPTRGIEFVAVPLHTSDGVELYAALAGSGDVGIVIANDVPHPICEDLIPAVALARRAYRVIVFDYRDRGDSGASAERGRLDLDVAAAAGELRGQGSTHIVLMGSYAGAAASLVAATKIEPKVDAVVGISPTAIRGQYVQGPFDPVDPLSAAALVRIPVLYLTAEYVGYVPVQEARRVYRATASKSRGTPRTRGRPLARSRVSSRSSISVLPRRA